MPQCHDLEPERFTKTTKTEAGSGLGLSMTETPSPSSAPPSYSRARWVALLAGPLLGIAPLFLATPSALSEPAWRLLGLTAWMVCWWLSEAVPLPATALLPIPAMPLLGIADERDVVASYAHPLIFLFLGGFILAGAMQHTGLHRRIALQIVHRLATGPSGIVAGFMVASAALSMWISNTVTTVLMFGIALSVIDTVRQATPDPRGLRRFGLAVMLGVAYAASIGGVGTLIGTAPNALMAGFLKESYGIEISMGRWLLIGLPYVMLMLPLAWVWLTRFAFPCNMLDLGPARQRLGGELAGLGPVGRGERFALGVLVGSAVLWVLRSTLATRLGLPITDPGIAIVGAVLLLAVPVSLRPVRHAVDWETVEKLPWGVLILFGGSLTLAARFQSTGLSEAIGKGVEALGPLQPWLITLLFTVLIVLLTELTSNTATTATFLPIVGAIAVAIDISPALLAIPITIVASAAFMMPVATPPNTIVFAYREMRIGHMMRGGWMLNILAVAVVMLLMWLLGDFVFGGL